MRAKDRYRKLRVVKVSYCPDYDDPVWDEEGVGPTPKTHPDAFYSAVTSAMKNILLGMMLFGAISAHAETRANDACQHEGDLTVVGRAVLSCIEGRQTFVGRIGTERITVAVQIIDGLRLVKEVAVKTLDGQPTPVGLYKRNEYIERVDFKNGDQVANTVMGNLTTGFTLMMLPRLRKDGGIDLTFMAQNSSVQTTQAVSVGDSDVFLPQEQKSELRLKLSLFDGQQLTLPFGPPLASDPSISQYTIRLKVTRGWI